MVALIAILILLAIGTICIAANHCRLKLTNESLGDRPYGDGITAADIERLHSTFNSDGRQREHGL